MRKNFVGKGHFFRTVHLRLHDIDGAVHGIPALPFEVVDRDQRRDHRIHQSFVNLGSISQEDGRVGHKMPNVPHPQQCASFHGRGRPVSGGIGDILIQATRH